VLHVFATYYLLATLKALAYMLLTDLATILDASESKVYRDDPLVSKAEFTAGMILHHIVPEEELEAIVLSLDTSKSGVFPYSDVCKWYLSFWMKIWPSIVPPYVRPPGGANAEKKAAARAAKAASKSKSPPKIPKPGAKKKRLSTQTVPIIKPGELKKKRLLINKLTISNNDAGFKVVKATTDDEFAAEKEALAPAACLGLWNALPIAGGVAQIADVETTVVEYWTERHPTLAERIALYGPTYRATIDQLSVGHEDAGFTGIVATINTTTSLDKKKGELMIKKTVVTTRKGPKGTSKSVQELWIPATQDEADHALANAVDDNAFTDGAANAAANSQHAFAGVKDVNSPAEFAHCVLELVHFARVAELLGMPARFSAEIYTRGCHWIPRMIA
jgi:hypothetical protein